MAAAGPSKSMRLQRGGGGSDDATTGSGGGGGSGGSGGACIGDLPDALLSLIFESTYREHWPSIALVSPRWHRVLHATPSLWSEYLIAAPEPAYREGGWGAADQEAWLAAKLRQLRRVSPAVQSLLVDDTAGADVLADVLLSLTGSQLTRLDTVSYELPITATAVRLLASFSRLEDLTIGSTDHGLPANCSWAVGQLTALSWLWLQSSWFPADLPAALAHLSLLETLRVNSAEQLPDVQPLTALSQLQELELEEAMASAGLELLPAATFPNARDLNFKSPFLKVGDSRFAVVGDQPFCEAHIALIRDGVRLCLNGVPLVASGAVGLLTSALKPAISDIVQLSVSICTLSGAAWRPPAQLGAVTGLRLEKCLGTWAGSSPAGAIHDALQQMTSLSDLSIIDCDLSSSLPPAIRQLSGLTSLALRGTKLLATLPPLACMEGLERLDLDNNLFSQLPALGSAPNLTTLHMHYNTRLALDAASVDRLAAEAPRLRFFGVGGTTAAGARLAKKLPSLTVG